MTAAQFTFADDEAALDAARAKAVETARRRALPPVLCGDDAGLVTAIVGITRIEIVFDGAADHAGTTLMEYRKDASLAAARGTAREALENQIGEEAEEEQQDQLGHVPAIPQNEGIGRGERI